MPPAMVRQRVLRKSNTARFATRPPPSATSIAYSANACRKRTPMSLRTLVCAPCELALCPYTHECMRGITADEVYSAAAKALNG